MASTPPPNYLDLYRQSAAKYGVPADLLAAQGSGESNFDPNATSPMGAHGIAQFMPDTWRGSWNPFRNQSSGDPRYAIPAQALYMSRLHKQFGDWNTALAAYNAGTGAVRKYGGVPPYSETQNYIRTVNARRARFPGLAAGTSGGGSTIPPRVTSPPERQPGLSIPTALPDTGGGGGFGGLRNPFNSSSFSAQTGAPVSLAQQLINSSAQNAGIAPLNLGNYQTPTPTPTPVVGSEPNAATPHMPDPPNVDVPTLGKDIWGDKWQGAKTHATALAQLGEKNGLSVVSEKRDRQNTSSGGRSDHWVGSHDSYAYDLSNGSTPTPEMDHTAAELAEILGTPNWKGGVLNATYGPYRYQLIYRSMTGGNHYNHVHLGVRRTSE